jgi:hypothetical protein
MYACVLLSSHENGMVACAPTCHPADVATAVHSKFLYLAHPTPLTCFLLHHHHHLLLLILLLLNTGHGVGVAKPGNKA